MELSLNDVIDKLNARKSGSGYQAHCPCHDDKEESLSVGEADSGKLLIYCHAGCEYSDIIKAMGAQEKQETKPKFTTAPLGTVVATYRYLSAQGNLLYEKVRFEPKTFRFRTWVDGKATWGNKSGHQVLLNLPDVLQAASNNTLVCICEGEKDCETIAALNFPLVVTTNAEGASGWTKEYTEALAGCRVMIIEDNDEAGRLRTASLTDKLKATVASIKVMRFQDMAEKSDISDYLATFPTFDEKRIALDQKLRFAPLVWEKTLKKFSPTAGRTSAIYRDYIDMIYSLPDFGKIGRCLLTDEIMVQMNGLSWSYINNKLDYIKSYAREYGKYFVMDAFQQHLERHRYNELEPKLLIDFPEWDHVDRIREMANLFMFNNVGRETFYQLLCDWGSGVFKRLKNPSYQNPCVIFQGDQGIGKDALIDALCAGLEGYFLDFSMEEKTIQEAKKQLHTAVVFTIPEFDKAAKIDIAALKDVIGKPHTNERLSYDKRSEKRPVRASFIASCNQKHILIDSTGNRRFWIFEAEYLGFESEIVNGKRVSGKPLDIYPGLFASEQCQDERRQILAQFRHLADCGFKATTEALREMQLYIATHTPEDADDQFISEWESMVAALEAPPFKVSNGVNYYTYDQVAGLLDTISRRHQKKLRYLQQELGLRGYREKTRTNMIYCGKRSEQEEEIPF